MTKLQKLLVCLAVSATGIALAALPPQAQRAVEFREIINSAEITELFIAQGELIDGVVMLGWDLYRVTGGECQLDVYIVDKAEAKPEGWVGPRQFELQLGQISCADDKQ